MTAIALTIAGSDPSGGAGIQGDLKTFAALRVYGASVLTALTVQNTQGVQAVHDVPADFVSQQIEAIFADLDVRAVKIGMLSQPATIRAVADALRPHAGSVPIVLDPVMVATSGDRLMAQDAVAVLWDALVPLATVITPNLPEAAALLDAPTVQHEGEAVAQARRLLERGARAVLIKGGHAQGDESVDHLVAADGALRRFAGPRILTRNTHGTGCTLAAAVTAGLAQGLDLARAVARAKTYVTDAIAAADALHVGRNPERGHGPLHHFHALWG